MKNCFWILLSIIYVQCSSSKESPSSTRKMYLPRLPLLVTFTNTPDSLQEIFTREIRLNKIKTIDQSEAKRLMSASLKEGVSRVARDINFDENTVQEKIRSSTKPTYFIFFIDPELENHSIDGIKWRVAPMLILTKIDTSSRYFYPPDSIKQNNQKIAREFLKSVLESGAFK